MGPCGGRVNSIFKILTELVSLECLSPWPGTEAQIREIRFSLFSGLDSVIVFNKMRKKKKHIISGFNHLSLNKMSHRFVPEIL